MLEAIRHRNSGSPVELRQHATQQPIYWGLSGSSAAHGHSAGWQQRSPSTRSSADEEMKMAEKASMLQAAARTRTCISFLRLFPRRATFGIDPLRDHGQWRSQMGPFTGYGHTLAKNLHKLGVTDTPLVRSLCYDFRQDLAFGTCTGLGHIWANRLGSCFVLT
jgi:hypothetical protein